MPAPAEAARTYFQRQPVSDLSGSGQERGVRPRAATRRAFSAGGAGSYENGGLRRDFETGQTIAAYAERFRGQSGGQEGIFSHGPTPLLEVVNRAALTSSNGLRTIVEAGAGEGLHAVLLARQPLSTVVAVEPNAEDTGIHHLLTGYRYGLGSRVDVVEEDMFAVLGGIGRLANGSVDTITVPRDDEMFQVLAGVGSFVDERQDAVAIHRPGTVYSSSVAHLFPEPVRRSLWKVSAAALPPGGILAASLKAEGDAQQSRAEVVDRGPEGIYGQDPEYPDITRLFVSDPGKIVREMGEFGLEPVCPPLTWSTPGYDFPGEDARHVGFLMRKAA